MLKLYIIGLSCIIYTILNIVYVKYITNKDINIRELIYNIIFMSLSIYGSFEFMETVLPSLGINLLGTIQSGGKSPINVFTNEPSF
jgi:hypothetical protein